MNKLNRQSEVTVSYNKIIEISDYLLSLDKDDYERYYSLLPEAARVNYHPKGYYYNVLPYRARVRIRKGEIQDLIKDLSEFLNKCSPQYLDEAKEYLQSELRKETGFDEIKNNPQLQELLEKQTAHE
jgi:hypothetical protein